LPSSPKRGEAVVSIPRVLRLTPTGSFGSTIGLPTVVGLTALEVADRDRPPGPTASTQYVYGASPFTSSSVYAPLSAASVVTTVGPASP